MQVTFRLVIGYWVIGYWFLYAIMPRAKTPRRTERRWEMEDRFAGTREEKERGLRAEIRGRRFVVHLLSEAVVLLPSVSSPNF